MKCKWMILKNSCSDSLIRRTQTLRTSLKCKFLQYRRNVEVIDVFSHGWTGWQVAYLTVTGVHCRWCRISISSIVSLSCHPMVRPKLPTLYISSGAMTLLYISLYFMALKKPSPCCPLGIQQYSMGCSPKVLPFIGLTLLALPSDKLLTKSKMPSEIKPSLSAWQV